MNLCMLVSALLATPVVHHTPRNQVAAGKSVLLHAEVTADGGSKLIALARATDQPSYTEVAFARADDGGWTAELPSEVVRSVGLLYAIVSQSPGGERHAHFASAGAPHAVVVRGRTDSEHQAEQLARYGGKRARFTASGSVVAYGTRLETPRCEERLGDPCEGVESDAYSDRFWRSDLEFTYRPLNVVHDFRLGFHVLRGEWSEVDGEAVAEGRSPGLYYAHGEVNFELHRWFSVGLRPIVGVNAQGFVVGGGGVVRVGDMTGTHLSTAADAIDEVGYLTDLRLHWATVPRFPMALGVEFTNWPAGDDSGSGANLSYDLGWQLTDHWTVALRAGTAQRDDSLTAGWQGRLALHYDL